MDDIKDDELLDTPAAAKILNVEPNTLEVWRVKKRHALPYVKIGRLVRYRRSALMAFLTKNEHAA